MPLFRPDLFLNPGLLAGVALVVVPVVLHLLLRSKPKKFVFPALRLIQARKQQTVRRLRLRHLWLLLLRMALIALLVFAVARPSVPAANYGLTLPEGVTLTIVLAVAAAAYFAFVVRWRRQHLPRQTFVYRRTMLRAGVGAATLVLLLLLVAWPYQQRIAAEVEAPPAELADNLPVAAVFLFDTSDSMRYRFEGKTRLEVAQKAATGYLNRLPHGSRVAVGGSGGNEPWLFRDDPAVAHGDIERLNPIAGSVPLDRRIREAALAQQDDRTRTLQAGGSATESADEPADRFLREIYVFTDLAKSGWQTEAAERLRRELERLPFVHVYLVDLGVDEPTNIAVRKLELSRESLPAGTPLMIDVTLSAVGTAASPAKSQPQTIELKTVTAAGQEETRAKRVVTVPPGESVIETFSLSDLAGPYVQGRVVLGTTDPLTVDNERYFTVHVEPPPAVLIVSGRAGEGVYFKEALAPTKLEQVGRAPFRVDQQNVAWLEENHERLTSYDAVCLVNVPALTEESWQALESYVRGGGGLATFLGSDRVDSVNWNGEVPQSFLPGWLDVRRDFEPPESLSLTKREHPLLSRLFTLGGAGYLSRQLVSRCWVVQPATTAEVVASYTRTATPETTPAVLTRSHGSGRTLMLTTAATPQGWSEIAQPSWPFLVFAQDIIGYLRQQQSATYNFPAGAEVSLALDRDRADTDYLLRKPGGVQTSVQVAAGSRLLVVEDAQQVGHYLVLDADSDSQFHAGFSVNRDSDESDFTKLSAEQLEAFFGPDGYRLGQNLEELERVITEGRLGQELFPHVLLFALIFFCLEHLVANRFYESEYHQVPQ